MRRRAVLHLALFAFGCGGGAVDPGFYGEIEEARARPTRGERPRRVAELEPSEQRAATFDRPKLVVIRAAWCHFCREAEPSIMAAYRPYAAKIDLVVLDVTDDDAIARSRRVAAAEGVAVFFGKYAGRTPTVGVFTARDQGRLVHGDVGDPEVVSRELEHGLELTSR